MQQINGVDSPPSSSVPPQESQESGMQRWLLLGIIGLIFLAALGIRVYHLTDLPLDFQPTRQLQSMIKARGMYYQNLASAPAWQREMALQLWNTMPTEEPEIIERLAAFSYRLAGGEYLWIPRLFSILFWLLGGLPLWGLARSLAGAVGGLAALLFYLFAPYAVISSRSFQPDPLMVMFILFSLWALYRWIEHPSWSWAVAAGLLAGLAILVKLMALFFIAGALAGFVFGERGLRKSILDPQLWAIGILCLLPTALFSFLGIFMVNYLNSGAFSTRIHLDLLLQPLYYLKWDRKIEYVVGIPAFLAALLGSFLALSRRSRSFLFGLWAGYFLFGVLFIYFYATHDYYHMPLVPLVALGIAPLTSLIARQLRSILPGVWPSVVIAMVLFLGTSQALYESRATIKSNNFQTEAAFWRDLGDKLRAYRVVALSDDYNMRLAYWGWLNATYWLSYGDIQNQIISGHNFDLKTYVKQQTAGKDFFLITDLVEFDYQPELKQLMFARYPIYDQGQGYVIFDLRNPRAP